MTTPPRPDHRSAPHGRLLELRPGDGGQDAETFAAELVDAFTAYATRHGFTTDDRTSPGARTVLLAVTGSNDPARWDRFAGVHRVQRIPRNDTRGRRHTSTVTVAVLPLEHGPVADLDRGDVRIDTFRGTGPGGQHRNKTDSGVRATHLPTGITVTVTRGRSQHQNRATALAELARRLHAGGQAEAAANLDRLRTSQVAAGTGGAAAHLLGAGVADAKAFTYNSQRGEVTEHTTGDRWPLPRFLRGHMDRPGR